jgi:uncharacterized short protein YbdD (DUF466 family)
VSAAGAARQARALARLVARAWQALRVLTGDADYDTYLARKGGAPLSREAFYLDTLSRRYGRPNRCC